MALKLALELFINKKDFEMYIEYEKVTTFDDIYILHEDMINAYQVKYSVNTSDIYTIEDFIDSNSPVYFGKFTKGWEKHKIDHDPKKFIIHLYSNRGIDNQLSRLIGRDGFFQTTFIEGRMRLHYAVEFYEKIKEISELSELDFIEFVSCFHFQVDQAAINETEDYIIGNLLDHQLGINNPATFTDLISEIRNIAINRRDPLTPAELDLWLKRYYSRQLLSQSFDIDEKKFILHEGLKNELDKTLENIDGSYVIISGLPGSGKSTSLTKYFDEKTTDERFVIVKYYCFVSINDNLQRLRLEAQSFRTNLLTILRDIFPEILSRRYDYSERSFFESLNILSDYLTKLNKKIIIFLDGLDHTERFSSQLDRNLLFALPQNIPDGIIFLISSQELASYPLFLSPVLDNSNTHIEMPLFTRSQNYEYLRKKSHLELEETQLETIYRKSEGLPLYLSYISEELSKYPNNEYDSVIENLPRIPDGDIKNYYEMLWGEYESLPKVKHLCGILACLKFPIEKEKLFGVQGELIRPEFEECFKKIRHLLKRNQYIRIFHNSFREFIINKIGEEWKRDITIGIFNKLKEEEGSPNWFKFVFDYAIEAEEYDFIIEHVNWEFIDTALLNMIPSYYISNAILYAAKSAEIKNDLVSLSRISVLALRTKERIDYNLNNDLLAKALIALDEIESVLNYSYSFETNKWYVNILSSLQIIKNLAKRGYFKLANELFDTFQKNNQGSILRKEELEVYISCLGVFTTSVAGVLEWLEETSEDNVPNQHNQYLQIFLDSVVKYKDITFIDEILTTKTSFDIKLLRIMLIRSLYKAKKRSKLQYELEELSKDKNLKKNSELCYFGAFAGLDASILENLLEEVELSTLECPELRSRIRSILHKLNLQFLNLVYLDKIDRITEIQTYLRSKDSLWTSYLLYILEVARIKGCDWKQGRTCSTENAFEAIDILINLKKSPNERIFDLVDVIRHEIQPSILYLTNYLVNNGIDSELENWFDKIIELRDSITWTYQFGINEYSVDFSFELRVFENLSEIKQVKPHMYKLIEQCEESYRAQYFLKGSDRSEHFFRLAKLYANCGFIDKAHLLIEDAIKSTLIYGYHKDMTLSLLNDILHLLNRNRQNSALNRCLDVIELVDWMPNATDGDHTRYFPLEIFKESIKVDIIAAIAILRLYYKQKARWQFQYSLVELIKHIEDVDFRILWELSRILTNVYSEDFEYPKQIFTVMNSIITKVEASSDLKLVEELVHKLDIEIRRNISPRHWENLSSKYWSSIDAENIEMESENLESDKNSEKGENRGFNKEHLTNRKELLLKNRPIGLGQSLRNIGLEFLQLGEISSALECLELAYRESWDFRTYEINKQDLILIHQYDNTRARNLVLNHCNQLIQKDMSYQVPGLIATALDVFQETNKLEDVYDDFFNYCKMLLSHFPENDTYKNVSHKPKSEVDINNMLINIILDQLDFPEVDFEKKIIDIVLKLALTMPNETISLMIQRFDSDNYLTRKRILNILYIVSVRKPQFLVPFIDFLIPLHTLNHFTWRVLIAKINENVENFENVPKDKNDQLKLKQVKSSQIKNINIEFKENEVSSSFTNLIEQKIPFSIQKILKSCCLVLNINFDLFLGTIEKFFKNTGWLIESESDRLIDDWSSFVHPQGYPFIDIYSNFMIEVELHLNSILFDLYEENYLDQIQISSLWEILQPVDPIFDFMKIQKKPDDIQQLNIDNKDDWISQILEKNKKVIKTNLTDEWVTIFEERFQNQDEQYNVPYKFYSFQFSYLIKDSFGIKFENLIKIHPLLKIHLFTGYKTLNITSVIDNLQYIHGSVNFSFDEIIPLICYHENSSFFWGYWKIASMTSYLINKYSLTVDEDLNLYYNENCVIRFQSWQEGCLDLTYSREKYSKGIRILIERNFLEKITRDCDSSLVQFNHEVGHVYGSIYEKKPLDMKEAMYFNIFEL